MFKEFLMKQMFKRQGIPEDQIDMVMAMMKKDPGLFTRIAEEVKQKMNAGKDQMQATMEVMQSHQNELRDLMKK